MSNDIGVARCLVPSATTNEAEDELQLMAVPLVKRFFPAPTDARFRELYDIYRHDARVQEWFGPAASRRTLEDYYDVLVTQAEAALQRRARPRRPSAATPRPLDGGDGGGSDPVSTTAADPQCQSCYPLPVAILARWGARHDNAAADASEPQPEAPRWRVIGYFGCRRFAPGAGEHTVGIFLQRQPRPVGYAVLRLVCSMFAQSLQATPSRVQFTTKVGNPGIYRLLRTLFHAHPSLQHAMTGTPPPAGSAADRVEFLIASTDAVRRVVDALATVEPWSAKEAASVADMWPSDATASDLPPTHTVRSFSLQGVHQPPSDVALEKSWQFLNAAVP